MQLFNFVAGNSFPLLAIALFYMARGTSIATIAGVALLVISCIVIAQLRLHITVVRRFFFQAFHICVSRRFWG